MRAASSTTREILYQVIPSTNPCSLRIENFSNTRSLVVLYVLMCRSDDFPVISYERAFAFPCPSVSQDLSVVLLPFEKFLRRLQQELTEPVKKLACSFLQKILHICSLINSLLKSIFSWRWWCADFGFFWRLWGLLSISITITVWKEPISCSKVVPKVFHVTFRQKNIFGNNFFLFLAGRNGTKLVICSVPMANFFITHG